MTAQTLRALTGFLCNVALALGVAHARAAEPTAARHEFARGEYLAKIGGCASCHTEPKHGAPFAGGLPVPTPFGAIYSTNITPDPTHGIGRYSFEDFKRALREGTAPGGRHLYPAMPYTAYAKANEADLRELYLYLLKGVAPVGNAAPPNDLDFPFNQRWALRFWKMMFLPRGEYVARPGKDAEWNRGAYLVQSFGHCGACHTPRGPAFQERAYDERSKHYLTGEVNDLWYASNLTGDPGSGLGRVSAKGIASFLGTGHGEGLVAFGTMGQEVEQNLQYLSEQDLSAVAAFLKSLPPQKGAGWHEAQAETNRSRVRGNYTADVESIGAAVYRGFCTQCHQHDGRGVSEAFPRLAGNPSVLGEDASSLVRLVIEGGRSPVTAKGPPPQAMPGFVGTLTDVQMAQVLTFIRQSWGNDARPVWTNDVSKVRRELHR